MTEKLKPCPSCGAFWTAMHGLILASWAIGALSAMTIGPRWLNATVCVVLWAYYVRSVWFNQRRAALAELGEAQ